MGTSSSATTTIPIGKQAYWYFKKNVKSRLTIFLKSQWIARGVKVAYISHTFTTTLTQLCIRLQIIEKGWSCKKV